MIEGMKKLSVRELEDLIKRHKTNKYTQEFVDFAHSWFGENAHRIVVHVSAEYNDNYYDDRISGLKVYDKDNKELERLPETDEDAYYDARYDLPVPLGRDSYGDDGFKGYTFIVGSGEQVPDAYIRGDK